jgi:thioredoxin reductase (NADPH)
MFTSDVENYPGFPEKVSGQELMVRFREQAEKQGTEIITADVQKVDFSSRPFKVWVGEDENILHLADSVIIATGARANYLGLDSEDKLKNKGVSACAVCDGALFRNQPVVVIGGGDTAMEEATYLSSLCSHVTLVHRRDEFRASKSMIDRTVANPKIKILYSHVVEEVLDVKQDTVTGVVVKDLKTGAKHTIEASAMFVAIGHTPMTDLFVGQLETHENGYLKTVPGSTRTNIPGVFASGDVQDWTYRQAVTAAGSGCMAALDAERWLSAEGDH